MSNKAVKIQWEEAEIKEVLDYFAKDYESDDGKIITHEAWVDFRTGKVAFKLFIQEQ